MARRRKPKYKGRPRQFNTGEEIERQMKDDSLRWKEKHKDEDESSISDSDETKDEGEASFDMYLETVQELNEVVPDHDVITDTIDKLGFFTQNRRSRNKTLKMQEYENVLKSQKSLGKETVGKKDIKDGEDIQVFCYCRKPDDGEIMVFCNSCEEWFHGRCVGILSEMDSQKIGDYFCDICMKEVLEVSQEIVETSFLYEEEKIDTEKDENECQVSQIQEAVCDLRSKIEKKDSIIRNQCDEIVKLKNEVKRQRKEIIKRKSESDEMENVIGNLNKGIKKSQNAHENATSQISKVLKEKKSQDKKIIELKQEIESVLKENKDLKKENLAQIDLLQEFDNTFDQQKNSDLNEDENISLKTQIESLENIIKDITDENSRVLKEVNYVRQMEPRNIKDKNAEIENLKDQTLLLKESVKDLNYKLEVSVKNLYVNVNELEREKMLNTILIKKINEYEINDTTLQYEQHQYMNENQMKHQHKQQQNYEQNYEQQKMQQHQLMQENQMQQQNN